MSPQNSQPQPVRHICLLFILSLLITIPFNRLHAQSRTIKIDPTVFKHLDSVVAHYEDPVKKGNLVTRYFFSDSVRKFQYQVSGIVIKSGQVQSISTVLDDKSLTLNYTLPIKKWHGVTLQPTVTGASSKGFINLFTGDKFSRTLTGGFNINTLFKGTGYSPVKSTHNFRYRIKNTDDALKADLPKYKAAMQQAIADLYTLKQRNAKLFTGGDVDDNDYKSFFSDEQQLKKLLASVKDLYPQDLDLEDPAEVGAFIDELNDKKVQLTDYITSVKRLKGLDSVQALAPFTHFKYRWITLSPKLNQKDWPIYDAGKAANLFTRTETDYYFSLAASYNLLYTYKKGSKLFFYPGVAIQNARLFNSDDSLSINVQKPLIPGVDSVQKVQSTGFYEKVADRKWVIAFNLPVMYYWAKGFGIDVGIGAKFTPGYNDYNAHIGFFFPVPGKGGQSIVLEPIIKYDDDQRKHPARNFDKFSFGFNLSLALPSFISGS